MSVQKTRSQMFEGPTLFVSIALALGVIVFAILLSGGFDVEAIRLAVRQTARTSLILFLAAFCASSLHKYWPGEGTAWLVRNRRWFGLGFAFSHLLHAIVLLMFLNSDSETFWSMVKTPNLVIGGTGYFFITMLAATSFDGAVRKLGPANWKRLHTLAVWVIWGNFMLSNAKRIPVSGFYLIPVALLLGALALRLSVRFFRRKALPS
jgi:methionine sulfoxide reductase heme-binding subunit